ncbi:restriction endonuclease subunit S [Lacrimispora aerotolerans]|uniref:restriction endonuclease subunit S n=1 Tax=Lacrimispora aerotolerans TaxID=36832 RepID=UPI0006908DA4|nr:restriction endonuclease subunit S [Lacrimispora aerotolerans]
MVDELYKTTDLGRVPYNWKVKNIMDVVESIKIGPFGSQLKKEYLIKNGKYRVYGQENVYKKDFTFGERYLTKEHFQRLRSCELIREDFVISSMGTIGKCHVITENIMTGIMDSHLIRLRLNTTLIDSKYLLYLFGNETGIIINQISKLSVGGIMDGLSTKIIKSLNVVLPPIAEQHEIAEVLSDVDKLIQALERLIEKKKAIKQGTMQELLTGKKRIDGFSKKWDRGILGDLCDIYRGGSPRPIQKYLTNNSNGVNWIKIGDVSRNAKYIESTDEKIIQEGIRYSRVVHSGDFLLSNSMSFGRPYILKLDGCIHDGWLVIQDYKKNFNTEYLYYMLMSPFVLDQYLSKAAGSSVLNLNKELVSTVEVLIPELKEQEAIAGKLATFDDEINSLELKLEKYRQIKQGMMQELLTGRIRLI